MGRGLEISGAEILFTSNYTPGAMTINKGHSSYGK
jgi:hypothetical protein